METLVELSALERGLDTSTPLPPRLRSIVWKHAMSAYHAWCDLLSSGAYVEASSQLEKILVEICYIDRAIISALRREHHEGVALQ